MILNVHVSDQTYPVQVPDSMLVEGADFFARIDRDMDRGWQMSRDWVEAPDTTQRCQIVADRLLSALSRDNAQMVQLLAAYILNRMPEVTGLRMDTTGNMQETELLRA